MNPSRARFIATGVAAAALRPSGLRAQTAPLVHVHAGSAVDDDATPFLYAIESGLFHRYGLDADLQPTASGAVTAAGVVGGSFDVGKSSVTSLCSAHARGLPLVLVAPGGEYDSAFPSDALIVRDDSPIKSGADLNGKTIAVSALNDFFSLATKAWADLHGGDASSLKLVELRFSEGASAVSSGRIDAAIQVQPFLQAALATGKVRVLCDPGSALGNHYMQSAWFMSKDYVAKNPDTVERFIRAMREAATYCNGHHAETVPILAKFTGIDPTAVPAHRIQQGTRFDLVTLQVLIDADARYKQIGASFDARDFVYPAALR